MASRTGKVRTGESVWRANATLVVSAASFATTATIGILAFNIDARAKTFEAAGYVETRYFGVDLRNYCASENPKPEEDDLGRTPGTELTADSYNLYDGYIQNEVWTEAKARIDKYCGAVERAREAGISGNEEAYAKAEALVPPDESITNSALVYIEISSKTSTFSVSPTLTAVNVPHSGSAPVWEYVDRKGETEIYPLGSVRTDVPVRVPVAIVSSRVPTSNLVIVPKSIEWKSPVSGSKTRLDLDFVVSGRYWRSMRIGVTAS